MANGDVLLKSPKPQTRSGLMLHSISWICWSLTHINTAQHLLLEVHFEFESRKQRVRGGQDAKGVKGESLESRKQKVQEWKGRVASAVRRGARARRAAPDL